MAWSRAFTEYRQSCHEVIELLRASPSDVEQLRSRKSRELANALYRGSVVLLCSHLERYVESLAVEAIDAINASRLPLGKIPDRLRGIQIRDALDDLLVNLEKERTKGQISETIQKMQKLVSDYTWFVEETQPFDRLRSDPLISEFANPTPVKIRDLFRHFGIKDVIGMAVGRDTRPDRGSIEKKVGELVEKRNAVAHTGMTVDLTRQNVIDYLLFSRRLARGMDLVVGEELEKMTGSWPWS